MPDPADHASQLLRLLLEARAWFRDEINETRPGTLPTWVVDAEELIQKSARLEKVLCATGLRSPPFAVIVSEARRLVLFRSRRACRNCRVRIRET